MDQQAQQVRWEEESMGRKGMKCRPSCRQLERPGYSQPEHGLPGRLLYGGSQGQLFEME